MEREKLVQEVTKLYRERNRLARIHRKAELRVLTSLRRRRQVAAQYVFMDKVECVNCPRTDSLEKLVESMTDVPNRLCFYV